MSKHYALLDLELLDAFDDGLEDLELHGLHSNSGYRKLKHLYATLRAQPNPPLHPASDALGAWLSAALDDPQACAEFKAAVRTWFEAGSPAFHLPQGVQQ